MRPRYEPSCGVAILVSASHCRYEIDLEPRSIRSGKAVKASFTAKTDGTDSPVTGNPYGDTISIKQPSPRHLVVTIKKDGKRS